MPRSQIRGIRVVGARSGRHDGRWRAYSRDRGASFLLSRPFTAGERVRVRLRLEGTRRRTWGFTVAVPGATPPLLTMTTRQPDKLQRFVSAPSLAPPKITVRRHGAARSGKILLTPLPSPVVHPGSTTTVTLNPVGPGGPMIINGHGRLVWFGQLDPPDVAANLRIARFGGRRVLTWWEGPVTVAAYGLGRGVIADDRYRVLRTVRPGNGYGMDIHEFVVTGDGTALFTVYAPVLVHVPGTPAGTRTFLLDALVQQVDVATGLVMWEWHALGHIPLSESYATPANSAFYDAFHINSIQPLPRGRVLVSARDTSAVYLIRKAGGRILWRVGGKRSDLRLGPGARFWFQHDARLHPGGVLSLFDDEAGPPQKAPSSRALVLRLDHRRRRATVVRSLLRAWPTSAQSEGSVQLLRDGSVFAGFGAQPWISQFSPSGRLAFDARLPIDDGSYRAVRARWRARPRTRPVAAARRTPGGADVYASWNGATEVARWQVLAGASPSALRVVATARRRGFETRIPVGATTGVLAARALDARGRRLGTSAPTTLP
ncbi:MAG TPA: arylsulfotransferase family protein [Baekduia sp.]|nr:arylsulfotransferase family protein [Baekduia sp.]